MAGVERPTGNPAAHAEASSLASREVLYARINEQQSELALSIRQYSREQSSLWRLIPGLFLEAEARDGYSDDRGCVCYKKVLPIRNSLFVDLNNGEIVHYPGLLEPIQLDDGVEIDVNNDETRKQSRASDADILFLAAELGELDAVAEVEYFLAEAQKPHNLYASKTASEAEVWREEERKKTGLSKPDFAQIRRILDEYKQTA